MKHWEGEKFSDPKPEPNPDHLKKFLEGPEKWNEWRDQNPDVVPDLSGFDFRGLSQFRRYNPGISEGQGPKGASELLHKYNLQSIKAQYSNLSDIDLKNMDFTAINIDGADLTGSNLSEAILNKASLCSVILYHAKMNNTILQNSNLEDADLLEVKAEGSVFTNSNLKGARLAGINAKNSQFHGVDLHETDLREAEFQNTDLRRAKFDDAILWTTHFEGADLRGATGMRFDETIIRETKFSPRSPDRWSTLRRHYTGPRYAITLIMLIGFVLPYFVKAAGWVAASRTQETVVVALNEAITRVDAISQSDSTTVSVVGEAIRSVRDRLTVEGEQNWKSAHVWELLLGIDKGLWYFTATGVLILYNILRGMLTFVVGPMRDAEERSGVSPPHRIEGRKKLEKLKKWLGGGWAESYAWLWIPHKLVTVLYYVAVSSFVFHAINWMALEVWLPK